jgi:glycosyltransferase involved in cell wall biosynthesis
MKKAWICTLLGIGALFFSEADAFAPKNCVKTIGEVDKNHHVTPKGGRKVLFIVPHLVVGGLDKAFVDMVRFLPHKKFNYEVCILSRGGAFECFLPEKTKMVSLKEAKKSSYSAVVSYAQWIRPKLWVHSIKAQRYIQWLHADLKTLGQELPLLTSEGQKGIDLFVGVSETASNSLLNVNRSLKNRIVTIRNCIDEEGIIANSYESQNEISSDGGRLNVVTVGRLADEKRVDRLIKVHGRLNRDGIKFHWYFVGDGVLRESLQRLAQDEGVGGRVHFLGNKLNPYSYMRAADVFVLGSDTESWGLVLTEAMILRKPILTTDVGGALEQITSDYNGLIVERSTDGIYKGLKRLLLSKETRERYSKALKKYHYSNEDSIKKIARFVFEN